MKRIHFLLCFIIASGVFTTRSNAYDYASWLDGCHGVWSGTNWVDENDNPLDVPGYPGTNHSVGISAGRVNIVSQNIEIVALSMGAGAELIVTNSRTLTLKRGINFARADEGKHTVMIPDGTMNIINFITNDLYDTKFVLGTNGSSGYLDLGAIWGATNNFASNFGLTAGITIDVRNGGLRVDADNISMYSSNIIQTTGQEITMRGDWLNPDGTTTFSMRGDGTGSIDIDGDWDFGGCTLAATLDTNGVSLIKVGGDAVVTNATFKIDSTESLTNANATYDLIRVPATQSISTNGLNLVANACGGVVCTVSLDENRNGYDYLVLTPQEFYPHVAITNPVADTLMPSGTNITIAACAFDADGTISKVEFFANTNKLGEVNSVPYSMIWSNIYGGGYMLKAVAVDNDDNAAESKPIFLGVQGETSDGRNTFVTKDVVITYDDACVQE